MKAKVEVRLRRMSPAQLAAPQIHPHTAVTSPSGKGTGQDTTRDSRRGGSLKVRTRTNQPNVTGVSSGPRKPGARIPPGVWNCPARARREGRAVPPEVASRRVPRDRERGRASWGRGLLPSGR